MVLFSFSLVHLLWITGVVLFSFSLVHLLRITGVVFLGLSEAEDWKAFNNLKYVLSEFII